MKFENIRVFNIENALRGMRNPKNSWHLSDSKYGICTLSDFKNLLEETILKYCKNPRDEIEYDKLYKEWHQNINIYSDNSFIEYAAVGPKDLSLAQTLIKAGPEHRKFLRQIFVTVDITAPLYW